MEESVRQLQDDKGSLVQDLSAVRDLCVKLENTKEVMSRQLTTRNIDTEQVFLTDFIPQNLQSINIENILLRQK